MDIQPIGRHLYVILDPVKETVTEGGIVLPDKNAQLARLGTVQGVGEDVIGGNGNRLLRLDFEAKNADITVSEIRVMRTGMGSSSDVASLRLENGIGDLIATGTISQGKAQFLPDLSIPEGDTRILYVVADIDSGAVAESSIGFKIESNHDITIDKGTVSLGTLQSDGGSKRKYPGKGG